jgi:hypothetical protein
MRENFTADWAFGITGALENTVRTSFPEDLRNWPLLQAFNFEAYTLPNEYMVLILRDNLSGFPAGPGVAEPFPHSDHPKVPPRIQDVELWQSYLRKRFDLREEDAAFLIPMRDSGKNSAQADYELFSSEERTFWDQQLKYVVARHKVYLQSLKESKLGRQPQLATPIAKGSIVGVSSAIPPAALAFYLMHVDGTVLETSVVLPGESQRRNAFLVYSTVEKLAEYNRLSGRDLYGFNIQTFVTLEQAERFMEQHRDYYDFVMPDPEVGQPSALEAFEQLADVVHQLASHTPDTPDEFSDVSRVGETPVEIQKSLKRFKEDHPDPETTAFILMQFGETNAHREIVDAIKEGLAAHGITGVRADDREYHEDLFSNVLTYMHGCGLGKAVFERIEAERFNPNVALEVGYMYAMRKPVCLLKDQTLSALHADLVGKLFRQFDPQDPGGTIPIVLSKWLSDKELPKL